MELNENLAKQLELDEEDVKLARLIGLLHDFGRFEQYSVYATYDDDLSFDHADYAVEVLFNGNEIRKYIADNRYDNIIKMAIKNHNKFAIEGNLNEKELLHTKMIRDTDKLDILYNGMSFFNIILVKFKNWCYYNRIIHSTSSYQTL